MKKDLFVTIAIIGALAFSAQNSFAATWECCNQSKSMSFISYLNPLPYLGIGENRTSFSLNPFTGFKNCNKCKIKRTACNECTKVKVCPACTRAFHQNKCTSCNDMIYIKPIQPRCTSCGK